jgi:hypothetical protein
MRRGVLRDASEVQAFPQAGPMAMGFTMVEADAG